MLKPMKALIVALLALVPATVHAQAGRFLSFVDTLNIATTAPETYVTWVYALSTPTSWPSSGIMVAFDCKAHRVKRLYHIVYQMQADSLGVVAPIVQDSGDWVPVSVPRTSELVCAAGASHPYMPPPAADVPDSVPLPTPKWGAAQP